MLIRNSERQVVMFTFVVSRASFDQGGMDKSYVATCFLTGFFSKLFYCIYAKGYPSKNRNVCRFVDIADYYRFLPDQSPHINTVYVIQK